MPLALSDSALRVVVDVAAGLPVDKRQTFLERVAAMLGRIRRPSVADVEAAMRAALAGLMQAPARPSPHERLAGALKRDRGRERGSTKGSPAAGMAQGHHG
jgi:hypothetical protein